jgi:hypothetical protein
MLMPETENMAKFVGKSRVPVVCRVLVLEFNTKMRTMTAWPIIPFSWYVTRNRRSLDIRARGFLNNGDVMRTSIMPNPRIRILLALVVAVGPFAVFDLVLMELQ